MKQYQYNVMLTILFSIFTSGLTLYAADPVFHLKNKSADSIQLDIKQLNKSMLRQIETIKKGGSFKLDKLNTKEETTLEIYFCPTTDYCKTNKPKKFTDTITASFTEGKKIYIKFDGKKITPQKGNKLGLTTSGYNIKNNVTDKDILTPKVTAEPTIKSTEKAIKEEFEKNQSKPAKPSAAKPMFTPKPIDPTDIVPVAFEKNQTSPTEPITSKPAKPSAPKPTAKIEKSSSVSKGTAWDLFPAQANRLREKNQNLTNEYLSFRQYLTPSTSLVELALAVYNLSANFTQDEFSQAYKKLNSKYRQMKQAEDPLAYDVENIVEKGHDILQKVMPR